MEEGLALYCRFFQEVNGPVAPDDVFVVESGAALQTISHQSGTLECRVTLKRTL